MVTGNDVFAFLNTLAPLHYQMDFDNSGFLVGDRSAEVRRILVALDITDSVITEAEATRADLIVSHHPLIFHKLSGVCADDPTGQDGARLGCGRIGYLQQEMPLEAFLQLVTERLHVNGVRYVSGGKPVHHIAVCGGSGGSMLELAHEAGCDTLVTADVKYDRFLTAQELGINLIDADHFCTENVVVPKLAEALQSHFPDVAVTVSALKQTVKFYAAR